MDTLLAGPLLRRTQSDHLCLWMATSRPVQWRLCLYPDQQATQYHSLQNHCQELKAARNFYIYLVSLPLKSHLP
ncbi:MAG TPA: alkaline phosphatase family protein, partial [Limnobacter sp.]|nr:alkaline phosphatase family protein [Limnobacter sp.]